MRSFLLAALLVVACGGGPDPREDIRIRCDGDPVDCIVMDLGCRDADGYPNIECNALLHDDDWPLAGGEQLRAACEPVFDFKGERGCCIPVVGPAGESLVFWAECQ